MANTSNKNFPHAYGAGRCIAAFSLSHPAGCESPDIDAPMLLLPPGIGDPAPDSPRESKVWTEYDPPTPSVTGTARLAYRPDRQPYNATSFGVYVTGSGTTRLPYRDAVAPAVPDSISPQLNEVLPATGLKPYSVVDDTQLGSSHSQVVVNVRGGEGYQATPNQECWYEVGLDWKVPPMRATISGSDFASVDTSVVSNWAAKKVASVRDSVVSSLWVNAAYSDSAYSEAHPEMDAAAYFGYPPDALTTTAFNAYMTTAPAADSSPFGGGYLEMPYGPLLGVVGSQFPQFETASPVDPFTVTGSAQEIFSESPPEVRAEIFLKVTSSVWEMKDVSEDLTVYGPNFQGTLEMTFAPVVRVWVMWPQLVVEGYPTSVPKALLRRYCRPVSNESFPGLGPSCVNVQVIQKNSTAPDGSVKPVYDLYENWSELG